MSTTFRTLLLSCVLALGAPVHASAQEHEGSAEHEAHGLDWNELTWQFIDFAVTIGLIAYMARKPMAQFLGKRRSDIAEQLAEAQRMKAAAEEKFAEYQRRVANLDADLAKLKEEIARGAEAERDRIMAEADRKAAQLGKDADFVIEQRVKQLRLELRGEMVTAAVAAAEKVLRERTTDADQETLAKDFVAKLGPLAKTGKVQQ